MKKQEGLTSIGWLSIVIIFGLVFTLVAKLAPFYLDDRFIVSTLKRLAEDPTFPQMTPSHVQTKLQKAFQINNIRDQASNSIKVNQVKNATIITVEYEERVNILSNIDVVLTFNSLLDSSRPNGCCSVTSE